MMIHDFIYGEFDVDDPLLVDLIKSKPVQRLKKVSQYGVPQKLYTFPGYSRYDHSVGVMLLLRNLYATREEQVAGLLHDVSHTAFSHVVDWTLGNTTKENFQDTIHEMILINSEIPGILSSYSLDVKKIADLKNYSLLECEAPDLCADRIDYALREFHLWANPGIVGECISSLVVYNKRIIFDSKEIADAFARTYLKCQTEHWGGASATLRFYFLSQMLKVALMKNVIVFEDLYEDDDYVMKKLIQSNDNDVKVFLNKLATNIKFKIEENNPDITLKKKFRYVDPEFMYKGEVYKLSNVDSNYKIFLGEHRKINESGIKVKILI